MRLGLAWLFAHPGEGILKLMLLTLTPNFLDILPMYLVLLAMVPAVMLLAQVHPRLAMCTLVLLWGSVHLFGINLPGGPDPGMTWFFNPFAWQLVFFIGFSFGMGWLKTPKLERGVLFWVCVGVLVASVPLNFWAFTDHISALERIHDELIAPTGKTNLNLLLLLHFLASAYVVLTLVEPVRHRLSEFRPIILVGQQALAAFMTSIVLAWVGGMVLDQIGRGGLATAAVNLSGFALLIMAAFLAQTYKGGGKRDQKQGAAKPQNAPISPPSSSDDVPRAMHPAE